MDKYIDAEKLIAEIDNIIEMAVERWDNEQVTGAEKLRDLLDAKITSLQQEHPDVALIYKPNMTISEMVDSINGKQPEVDLEKEIDRWFGEKYMQNMEGLPIKPIVQIIARHFYGLRNRALEKAARNVYESWMGGTMDDVRRDMVELEKVLNERKK